MSDLGEDELLELVVPELPVSSAAVVPTGDDAAVFRLRGDTVATTDMLVEGRHFRREWSSGYDIGWRAAMQNIADVVAMGARPISLVVSIGMPAVLEPQWLADFGRGIAAACDSVAPGCGVDGGDLTGADEIVVSVTAVGDMAGFEPLRRSGASAGDRLVHCGVMGRSRLGYELLSRGAADRAGHDPRVSTFLRPEPPVGIALAGFAAGGFTAAMDVSDGLVRDARRIAKASRVALSIDTPALAPHYEWLEANSPAGTAPATVREWLLSGGEDHGFLATLSPDVDVPEGWTVIGSVTTADDSGAVMIDGEPAVGLGGWDHFAR